MFVIKTIDDEFLVYDREAAHRSLDAVVAVWDDEGSAIRQQVPVQLDLPQGINEGSREHALWLFIMGSLDFRVRSSYFYTSMKTIVESHLAEQGEFVLAPLVLSAQQSPEGIKNLFERYTRTPHISPNYKYDYLFSNAFVLSMLCDDDVRDLDRRTGHDINMMQDYLVRTFKGVGGQTAAHIIRYMMQSGIWEFQNEYAMVLKVDTHKMRFPFSFGFFTYEGKLPLHEVGVLREEAERKLGAVYLDYASEQGAVVETMHKLDEVLWRLGEQYCSQKSIRVCAGCSVEDVCQGVPIYFTGDGLGTRYEDLLHQVVAKDGERVMFDRSHAVLFPARRRVIYPYTDCRS